MVCKQGTVGATKVGANMVAAAPAATAAVARWDRVVGMAGVAKAMISYYVLEQNAAFTCDSHQCQLDEQTETSGEKQVIESILKMWPWHSQTPSFKCS